MVVNEKFTTTFLYKFRVIFRVIFCVKQGQKWKKFEKLWKNYKPLNPLKSTEKEKQALVFNACDLAEDTGLEPAGLLHLTRFPGELLSHSVNPPYI